MHKTETRSPLAQLICGPSLVSHLAGLKIQAQPFTKEDSAAKLKRVPSFSHMVFLTLMPSGRLLRNEAARKDPNQKET